MPLCLRHTIQPIWSTLALFLLLHIPIHLIRRLFPIISAHSNFNDPEDPSARFPKYQNHLSYWSRISLTSFSHHNKPLFQRTGIASPRGGGRGSFFCRRGLRLRGRLPGLGLGTHLWDGARWVLAKSDGPCFSLLSLLLLCEELIL